MLQESDHRRLWSRLAYCANIVLPYGRQADPAVTAVKGIGLSIIDIIAPAHGVAWRSHTLTSSPSTRSGTSGKLEEKALAVYDSMWGSMIRLTLFSTVSWLKVFCSASIDLKETHISDVAYHSLDACLCRHQR